MRRQRKAFAQDCSVAPTRATSHRSSSSAAAAAASASASARWLTDRLTGRRNANDDYQQGPPPKKTGLGSFRFVSSRFVQDGRTDLRARAGVARCGAESCGRARARAGLGAW